MTDGYQWRCIGGHLVLDLCNTISWRLDPRRTTDRLDSAADLADWFHIATGREAAAGLDQEALDRVRGLRDATIRIIDAHLDGVPASVGDVRGLHEAWLAALNFARLSDTLPLTETVEPTTPARLVSYLALSTAQLLHRADLSTLRRCHGNGCGWLFLDTTRNHSRRWCDPFDCGNRARVRAYSRRRRRGEGDPG